MLQQQKLEETQQKAVEVGLGRVSFLQPTSLISGQCLNFYSFIISHSEAKVAASATQSLRRVQQHFSTLHL